MQRLQQTPAADDPIAPAWHTVLMILLVLGSLFQAKIAAWHNPEATPQPPPAIPFYLTGAVVLGVFWVFTWWGLRLKGRSLGSLVGGKWSNWKRALSNLAIGMLFWVFWYFFLAALKFGLLAVGVSNSRSSGMIFPVGCLGVGLVIFNGILSGIVEEVVFRGYLMAQFRAWTAVLPSLLSCRGYYSGPHTASILAHARYSLFLHQECWSECSYFGENTSAQLWCFTHGPIFLGRLSCEGCRTSETFVHLTDENRRGCWKSQNSRNLGDRKCLPRPRSWLIVLPSAEFL